MRKLFPFVLLFIISCTPQQKPIEYGKDGCAYCKMIIMDRRYGTELVTDKSKVYMFDAIECMVDYLKEPENKNLKTALLLVTPYDNHGELLDAKKAHYLRSPKLPSPMGKYLTAFSTKEVALAHQKKHGGKIYSWEKLRANFKEIVSVNLGEEEPKSCCQGHDK